MNIINMKAPVWLSASAAAALLGVTRQTLYAYVSRAKIRIRPDFDDPRRSLYHSADLTRIARRTRGRPGARLIAAGATSWGSPVLDSSISTVSQGRLCYRGQDAVVLSESATLEFTAQLLWQSAPLQRNRQVMRTTQRFSDATDALYSTLASRAARDPQMLGREVAARHSDGARLFFALSDAIVRTITSSSSSSRTTRRVSKSRAPVPVHERLAVAWRKPDASDLIRRALVLLADHELNASTFAARVAASTGAPLAAAVLAGAATLGGPLHGKASVETRLLLSDARRRGARAVILERLAADAPLPAFGHPLYPNGDVRAQSLLAAVRPLPLFDEVQRIVEELSGEHPNVDYALTAMAARLRLPDDAPFVLFAVARTVGWIAHALEQTLSGNLIRPRARYVGPALVPAVEADADCESRRFR